MIMKMQFGLKKLFCTSGMSSAGKLLGATVLAGGMLLGQGMAEAACDIWFDREAGIDRFQKVVVYPVAVNGRDNFKVTTESVWGGYNYEMHKRLNRHVKGITFYELADLIDIKDVIIKIDEEQRQRVLGNFPDEASRAKAVFDEFAADGYLRTYLRDFTTVEDYSPQTTVTVTKEAYTEDTGGPEGRKVYDKSSWTVQHTIPEHYSTRFILGMESTLYNEEGKKIFTYYNHQESYGGFSSMYTSQKDDLVDELKDVKKNKHKLPDNKKAIRKMKFGNINMPANLGNDEYLIKSLWFAYKEEAYKMKKVKVVPEDSVLVDYYVKMDVTRNEYKPSWMEPFATCNTVKAWKKKYKWYDKDGNEHEGKITRYEPGSIVNHYGHYIFSSAAEVGATMYLYDAHTNKLLYSKNYMEYNDKFADAYRAIFKDFYKNVDKYAEGKLKK